MSKRAPQVLDICVLTAGNFQMLQECLDAISDEMLHSKTPCNLYVFDNGSPAEELQVFRHILLRNYITQVRRTNKNVGYPAGANSAIGMGTSNLVLFVSDDVVLQPGCVDSLVNTMKEKPDVVLCGLKLLFHPNSTDQTRPAGKVQSLGHTIDLRGEILHPFMGWSADNPKTMVSGYRASVTGAAFIVRRAAFRAVRGFSEEYGSGYFEDVEMCLRLGAAGGKIYVDANATAYHYVGATFVKRNEGNSFQLNKLKFRDRNRPLISWTDWSVR